MSYILLFPRGSPGGWCPDLQHAPDFVKEGAIRTRLTTLQFYAHQLMHRRKENENYEMKIDQAFDQVVAHSVSL